MDMQTVVLLVAVLVRGLVLMVVLILMLVMPLVMAAVCAVILCLCFCFVFAGCRRAAIPHPGVCPLAYALTPAFDAAREYRFLGNIVRCIRMMVVC